MLAIRVEHVSKSYRIPHERHTTLVERLLSSFRPSGFETFKALDDVTLRRPAGRLRRPDRRERLGQIDAAQADGRPAGARRRTDHDQRVGRPAPGARPRLPQGAERHREHHPLRRRAGLSRGGHGGARRGGPRLRRARAIPRREAEEPLVGHADAPRVRDGAPRRGRHPAPRRGARRRRRTLPAEVLRRLPRAQGAGPHHRPREPRSRIGAPVLRSRVLARQGPSGHVRHRRRGGPDVPRRDACRHAAARGRGAAARRRRPRRRRARPSLGRGRDQLRRRSSPAPGRQSGDARPRRRAPPTGAGRRGLHRSRGTRLRVRREAAERARRPSRLLDECRGAEGATLAGRRRGPHPRPLRLHRRAGERRLLGARRRRGSVRGLIYDWINDYLAFTVEESTCLEGVLDLVASFECDVASCQPLAAAGATAPAGGRRD